MPGWEVYIVGGIVVVEDVGALRAGLDVREDARPLGVELRARVDARREALRGVRDSSCASRADARLRGVVEADPEVKKLSVYGFEEGALAVNASRSVNLLLLSYETLVFTPWKSSIEKV
jgi:hypothetical protein